MEAFSDRLEPKRLGRGVLLTADVGRVNDLRQAGECRLFQVELAQQDFKRAQALVVGELQLRISRDRL